MGHFKGIYSDPLKICRKDLQNRFTELLARAGELVEVFNETGFNGEEWKDIFQVIDRLNSRCKEAFRKLQSSLDLAHKVTDGRFRNDDLHSGISDMKTELESLQEKKEVYSVHGF